jgi:hypothetical protein
MRATILLLIPSLAAADPYGWPHAAGLDTLEARFPAPPGTHRVPVAADSFGAWLRTLPLQPAGAAVHLWDKREKPRQDVHAAVVALDVPPRDLQQCADAVMRLWAEYRWSQKQPVEFHPEPGKPKRLTWTTGPRAAFERWLIRVFADAGSASLAAELAPRTGPLRPGDVLIQGGYPGHAIIVLDVVERDSGGQLLLLGQSYMPAQELHVLKNLGNPTLSPWYDAATLTTGLATPEWRPFRTADVRHFHGPE